MPKLENAKHEEFALYLARGVKQGDAYKMAGYAENKGAASRLAHSIPIQERVEELRKEINQKIQKAMTLHTEEEWQSLADMGLTMEWVALQYKTIYEQSITAGAFPAANTAVQNIQKLIEMERNAKEDDAPSNESRINMSDMLNVLDKVSDIVKNAGTLPQEDDTAGDHARIINPDSLLGVIPE